MRPVLVVGGTGKTGRRVVSQLRARDEPVRVASRSSEHRFDWNDRASWGPALDGVGPVYVAAPLDAELPSRLAALSAEAKQRGAERLVLMMGSPVDLPEDQTPPYSRGEREAERAVRESGLAWTIVRANWFMQNFSEDFMLEMVLAGEIRLPTGEGQVAFVDTDDIAGLAVAALTEDGHAGQTYEAAGPRLMSFGDAAAEIAEATGRDVRYVPVPPDQYAAELAGQGVPEAAVTSYCDLFGMVSENRYARPSDDVSRVLGRPPRDFADFVRATAATGVWNA